MTTPARHSVPQPKKEPETTPEASPGDVTAVPLIMDRFTREMIGLLLAWAPYGDPPEDETVPRFGLTSPQLKYRIAELISQSPRLRLKVDDQTLLMRAAEILGVAPAQPRLRVPAVSDTPRHYPPAAQQSATRAVGTS